MTPNESWRANPSLQPERRMLVGGKFVEAASGERIDVENPASGEAFTTVPAASAEDVDVAVRAARKTFDSQIWRGKKYTERAEIMWRWSDLVIEHVDELAEAETIDNGMPLVMATATVRYSANTIRYFAGMCSKAYGRTMEISEHDRQFHAFSIAEPVGVAGLITPWNGPISVAATKASSAIAAGCSVVLKPAEQTPITSLRLAELALEAGIPEGVLNVVTGLGHVAGAALADHPDVDKISFTGSTVIGKRLVQASAGNLKRLSLELGGKSPVFIFDDADIEQVIPIAAMAIFANSGQVCVAGSRLFVQEKVFDKVVAGIAAFAQKMRLGSGLDPANQLGPLISAKQRSTVMGYVESGVSEGAEIVTGGKSIDGPGYFVAPTVFANTLPAMKIAREEIFGPVLVTAPFKSIDELALLGNASPYGLGAGIFTRDLGKAHRAAKALRTGNVWVNCYGFTDKSLPFGGFKQSGYGREGGPEGFEAFIEHKTVYMSI
jgi:acyl-CoA reductase-like NAD-dependent aldehyde dehydrogenase